MNASKKITHRPSWASYWKSWLAIVGILGILAVSSSIREAVIGSSSQLQNPFPLIALIPAALILFRALIHRYSRTYEIEDNRRIRNTTGIVSRARREFLLSDKIQTDLKQSIIGRLLNYGTLRFWTGDEQSGFAWIDVHDPARRETEVKRLVTSKPSSAGSETKPAEREPRSETHSAPEQVMPIDAAPPAGTQLADRVVILPPLLGIIQAVAALPKYIAKNESIDRDHRFVQRGEPLISIQVPSRDLSFGRQNYELVTIPSPVTGIVIKTGYSSTKESRDFNLKAYSKTSPSDLILTTIIPVKGFSNPDNGQIIFSDLRSALWAHREYLFRKQKFAKHPSKARFVSAFQTDEGVRSLLDELSNQDCEIADAKLYFHEYINEIWFKRADLRPFLRHLVDEEALRNFLEIWKTVPLDQSLGAALRALGEDA